MPLFGRKTLISVLAIAVALSALYIARDRESHVLDEARRAELGGQYATLEKGIVHYQLSEKPQLDTAQTVVLVNGFSSPLHIFDPTYEYLKTKHQVLRFDYYGRGYSDRIDNAYEIDLYVKQIKNLLVSLNIKEQINIIGLSMGGAVATHFTNRFPHLVKKVTLIDPLLHTPNRADITLVQTPGLGEYLATTVIVPNMINGAAEFVYDPESFPDWAEKFGDQTQYKGFSTALLRTARFLAGKNFSSEYERLGQSGKPVQLFWGTEDQVIPISDAEKIRALVPSIEFHEIPQAGHLPHYEKPLQYQLGKIASLTIRLVHQFLHSKLQPYHLKQQRQSPHLMKNLQIEHSKVRSLLVQCVSQVI